MWKKIIVTALFFNSLSITAQTISINHLDEKKLELSPGEHSAEINGLRFHYVVAGRGPLLIVQAPGSGIGSSYLQNGLAPLEKNFTLLFYDPRGSGGSSRPASAMQMSISDMVEDLESLRKYWGLDSFNLLGHSSGGAIALGYAERYPLHVHKLILVDSQLVDDDIALLQKKIKDKRCNDPQYGSSLARLEDSSPATDDQLKKQFEKMLPYYLYDPTKNLPSLLQTMTGTPSSWAERAWESSNKLNPPQQTAALSKVKAQTLIIVGRDDAIYPPTVSHRIHAGISRSTLKIYRNDGHFPWEEQPRNFFKDTQHFLSCVIIFPSART
jgi:proline iminopeptidase